MSTRIIGIDLAVTAEHRAAILAPATQQFVVKQMTFRSLPADLERLLQRAQEGAGVAPELVAVLEATSMAWHPVSLYLAQHGVKVYRVNGRMTKELRRVHSPHARSDRIDCQVLARLYSTCPEQLNLLHIPSGEQIMLQRACRDLVRWRQLSTAIENRLTAYDNWLWQGLSPLVPAKALNWVRSRWYSPWQVVAADANVLAADWRQHSAGKKNNKQDNKQDNKEDDDAAWLTRWQTRARQIACLYATPDAVGLPQLADCVQRYLSDKAYAEQQATTLYDKEIAPLYQRLYPDCPLTSIYGIGDQSAATYMAFIHSIDRFPTVERFRQWTGMVPRADQSGGAQTKGLHLTQAGPNLVKATLYLDANVARLWDPQLALIYYNQMTVYGKHHSQALCAVASHLANRIYAVLKRNQPYVLRNLDGNPISPNAARSLIHQQLHISEETRRRTNKRSRSVAPTSTE